MRLAVIAAFLAYAAALLALEWNHGQAAVRPYFTDLFGPVLLHAVNTTISSGLLVLSAACFAVCIYVNRLHAGDRAVARFGAIEGGLFLGLALDDRFILHERLPAALELPYFAGIAGLQAAAIFVHRGCIRRRRGAWPSLAAAALCFALMMAVDQFVHADTVLRLSGEDLLKSASSLALLSFAWSFLRHELATALTGARGSVPPG